MISPNTVLNTACACVRQVIMIDTHSTSGYILTDTVRFSGPGSLAKVRELVDQLCVRLGRDITKEDWYTKESLNDLDEGNLSIRCPNGIIIVENFGVFYHSDMNAGHPFTDGDLEEIMSRHMALPTHQIQAQRA